MAPAQRSSRAHAEAIEASLEIAARRGGDLTARVYELLFAREPQVQALFSRDTDGAIRGEMLMKVLESILDFVGERHYADHLVRAEAANHAGYDVPHGLFVSFFALVAEAVEEACGCDWTQSMACAWARTLDELDRHASTGHRAIAAS
jgi:hemoglobin-like flavoprotein